MHSFIRTHVISSCKALTFLIVCLFLLAACGSGSTSSGSPSTSSQATPTPVLDVYGTPIAFPQTTPQRIVSLTPSISEILATLNMQSHVVGVDFNTNYPAMMAAKPKVSDINGTYNVEQIVALHPDLILSTGGITKPYDSQLTKLNLHVVDLPPGNFEQTLQQIVLVGRLTGTEESATKLTQQLQQQINQIEAKVAGTAKPGVLLEVDDSTPGKPYVFGGGSFGDELLQDADASNIFHNNTTNQGYPQVTDEAVISANPQYVILTEDPAYGGDPSAVYKRANWTAIDALKLHHVYHINADIMQRPGPRLVEGLQCLAQIVHPDKFSGALPAYCSASV
jgi:iron complex transport system substrate-binding protein